MHNMFSSFRCCCRQDRQLLAVNVQLNQVAKGRIPRMLNMAFHRPFNRIAGASDVHAHGRRWLRPCDQDKSFNDLREEADVCECAHECLTSRLPKNDQRPLWHTEMWQSFCRGRRSFRWLLGTLRGRRWLHRCGRRGAPRLDSAQGQKEAAGRASSAASRGRPRSMNSWISSSSAT